ncbi:MAG: nucleotidyltransferase domain-containing protein [Myxococcota bacterium]
MDTNTLLERIRRSLFGREDIRVALLFGSRARRTERPDSDVDLAVAGRSRGED